MNNNYLINDYSMKVLKLLKNVQKINNILYLMMNETSKNGIMDILLLNIYITIIQNIHYLIFMKYVTIVLNDIQLIKNIPLIFVLKIKNVQQLIEMEYLFYMKMDIIFLTV